MEAEDGTEVLGNKKLNYQFLMLVRDQKYPEALLLGKKILTANPNNPSVKKFVDFIENNTKKLGDMVKQQEQYEEVNSDDESEEEEGEGEEEKPSDEEKDEKSDQDSKEQDNSEDQEEPELIEKPKKEVQLSTCTLNAIPHICTRHHQEKNGQTKEAIKNGISQEGVKNGKIEANHE